MCHLISVYAFDAAADPDAHPELGSPWAVPKLYYQFGFHYDRTVALNEAMIAAGFDGPYAERLASWKIDPQHAERMTTRVRVRRLLRGARPGAARPRHPGRPGGLVVLGAVGHPPAGLVDRGLGTGAHPGRGEPARGRPLRRHRGPGRSRPAPNARVQCRYDRCERLRLVLGILLQTEPNIDPNIVRPGWTPLLIIVLLLLVLVFLFFSMQKQMRKIRTPDDIAGRGASGRADRRHSPSA